MASFVFKVRFDVYFVYHYGDEALVIFEVKNSSRHVTEECFALMLLLRAHAIRGAYRSDRHGMRQIDASMAAYISVRMGRYGEKNATEHHEICRVASALFFRLEQAYLLSQKSNGVGVVFCVGRGQLIQL